MNKYYFRRAANSSDAEKMIQNKEFVGISTYKEDFLHKSSFKFRHCENKLTNLGVHRGQKTAFCNKDKTLLFNTGWKGNFLGFPDAERSQKINGKNLC